MQENIIDRLFESFKDLESAITSARTTLAQKGELPEEVAKRLSSYDTILARQRSLAHELCEHINSGNWGEVSRHVGLINGLSGMIRDDARAILSALSLNSDRAPEEEEMNYC